MLKNLFALPMFSGALGGRPKSALFIVGKNKNKYIYMDPHYVRSSINK